MAAVATRLLKAEEFFDFVHLPANRDKVFDWWLILYEWRGGSR
jgi:hypothetical protein